MGDPHFGNAVCGHLTATFGARWIGRGGPTAWPARSPDLTCYMKSVVYETDIDSEEELVACNWNKGNPWHLWKGTAKYGTSMHCLSGCHWACVPALVTKGQKTGSILTMQHWSDHLFFYEVRFCLLLCKLFGLTERIMWHRITCYLHIPTSFLPFL